MGSSGVSLKDSGLLSVGAHSWLPTHSGTGLISVEGGPVPWHTALSPGCLCPETDLNSSSKATEPVLPGWEIAIHKTAPCLTTTKHQPSRAQPGSWNISSRQVAALPRAERFFALMEVTVSLAALGLHSADEK